MLNELCYCYIELFHFSLSTRGVFIRSADIFAHQIIVAWVALDCTHTHQSGPRLISISGTAHKTNNMCINMCMNMYNTCVLGSCQLTSVLSPNSIHGYSPKEKGSFQPLSFLTGLQCTGPRMNRSSHHVWPTFSHNAAFADLSDRPFSQHTFDSS